MELREATLQDIKNEVLLVLDQLAEAQETGNLYLLTRCFIHDDKLVNIGSDMDEYWIGWKNFFASMQDLIQTRHGNKIYTRDTRITLADDKKTAWYSQMMDTNIETKGDPVRLEGFRHTGVLQTTDDGWKIVQSHISIPFNYIKERERI